MALTASDIEEFIALLREDASLRERVRGAIISDDFQALPGIVAQVAEELKTIAREVRSMRGELGRFSGRMYEFEYERKLPARIGSHFTFRTDVPFADYPPISDAYDAGTIAQADWDDLMRIDVGVIGRPRRQPDAPESVILIELSVTVDTSDVWRAARRAAIVSKLGIPVIACVDGELILPEAQALAKEDGVLCLVRKAAYPGDY